MENYIEQILKKLETIENKLDNEPIHSIEKLSLGKDDTIVFHMSNLNKMLNQNQGTFIEDLLESFKKIFPDNKCIIIDEDQIDISILKKEHE